MPFTNFETVWVILVEIAALIIILAVAFFYGKNVFIITTFYGVCLESILLLATYLKEGLNLWIENAVHFISN